MTPRRELTRSLDWWDRYGRYVLMATAHKDPVMVEGRDTTLVDADGNEYLDLTAGQLCALVGHSHPALLDRVRSQIDRLAHVGTSYLSPVVFEASARVAAIAPGQLERVLFLSTGAEANEYAIRLAKVFTGKSGTLALTKGYAGLTLQTASLTNYGKAARPLVPGTGFILTPDPTACPADREPLEWAHELLQQSLELNRGLLDNVAAIIVEPILSAGGLIVLPDGYLRQLRALADRIGALLIADEAQTGMGRTGRWFGVDHDAVVPDILVLSKGCGGGFPASAVVTTPAISDAVMTRANQYSSHQSDPLGAAATLAVVDIIEREGLVERAAVAGSRLMTRLGELSHRHPHLRHVRGRGLMVGFDVFRDGTTRKREASVGRAVEDFCRQRGVLLQSIQMNRFRVLPPLTISDAALERFAGVLDEALAAIAAGDAKPGEAGNRHTRAFERRTLVPGGVQKALRWAWTHSPNEWLERLGTGKR